MSHYYANQCRSPAGLQTGHVTHGNTSQMPYKYDQPPSQTIQLPPSQSQQQMTTEFGTDDQMTFSWCPVFFSAATTVCLGSACGFIGLLFSIFSYVDYKSGAYEHQRYKTRCAWGCTLLGLLLFLAVATTVILLVFVFPKHVEGFLNHLDLCLDPQDDNKVIWCDDVNIRPTLPSL